MMFDKVKKALRLTTDELDDEIKLAVNTSVRELERVGINTANPDELITTAAILYAWFYFNFRDDGEKYKKAFEALRDSLSVSADYIKRGAVNE